ncbi:CatA-like O-acetyltransferase [Oscillibacter sp.]|uniref:CatA-like O-acetyltransferase n=1 Tax=Oscillibacter sp. TaxID=1945593 RepID=UPI00289C39A6|nr:CatA-like O-acetyltransferase [Oscillibacter sp.]
MNKRIVDMTGDPRREQFAYFSSMENPYAGVTCQVDITALMERIRQDGTPFFLSLTYEVMAAANAVPQLRRRIEEGQVVEYESCRCSCTVAKPDGAYAYCTLDTALPFDEFLETGRTALETAKYGGTIAEEKDHEEFFFVSCVPWLRYTDMVMPVPSPAYSNVRISWGKWTEENGRTSLPVTILAHHALVDGIHLGRFYEELERRASKAR